MSPAPDLPKRPEQHTRSTWSTRAFASILPREWLVHPLEEDYGIDRRVEIFENGHTTGIFFNVQLKSTETGDGQQPADSIKRATLNYWAQTPDATLVVIGHEPTDTLWYRWAHLLPHDQRPTTDTRTVRCEEILDLDSAPRLAEEARAWRWARQLSRHLPIDVRLSGNTLYGESATPLKRAIAQQLSLLSSFFRVSHSTPMIPYMEVSIEDTRVMAGLRGNYAQQITWGLYGERDYSALAADVIASLALSCASVGAEDLCVRLLKIAAPHTNTLMEANAFGYAMALLTKHEANETVLTLIRRTATIEDHPQRDIAHAAVSSVGPHPDLARSVAHVIRDAARTWRSPAMGLYNAANMLGDDDSLEALRLYEEAATADPRYRTRGYWWRELGSTYWSRNEVEEAEQAYRNAIEYGDTKAIAFLADVLMRTGRYGEARATLDDAPMWNSPEDAQWRLTFNALNLVVLDLGIDHQERPTRSLPDFYPAPADDSPEALEVTAMDAIREDALNGYAYSGLAAAWKGQGKASLQAALTAAVIVNTDGFLWLNLFIETLEDRTEESSLRGALAQDAMWCAWRMFGESFADVVADYPFLDDGMRDLVLDFFDTVRPASAPMELRQHTADGNYESIFVPTDPRADS